MRIVPTTREDFEDIFWGHLYKEVVSLYSAIKDVCKEDDLSQDVKDIIKLITKER